MATVAKRQWTIPTVLFDELRELALWEGKSVRVFLRILISKHKRHRPRVELEELQNYWSMKAKANRLEAC